MHATFALVFLGARGTRRRSGVVASRAVNTPSAPLLRRGPQTALASSLLLVVAACGSPPPAESPAESPAASSAPASSAAQAAPIAPEASPFQKASVARGGQLYDTWWKVSGVLDGKEPTDTNPEYLKTQGKKTGSTTYRCKECHGWDYAGSEGVYGSGGRFTGVGGLLRAQRGMTPEALYKMLREGRADGSHKVFAAHLSEADTWDLVRFVKEGITDLAPHVSTAKKEPIGADEKLGGERFSRCAGCHGSDGKKANFGKADAPEYVGTIAQENPWEFLHKVRFGQPGTAMPAGVSEGWSMKDAVSVLAHARTLPVK
jgi:mono/diheme cytochrome c family protein